MSRDRGSAAVALLPCEEIALRGHIKSVSIGKKTLTDDHIVSSLRLLFPDTYSCLDRNLLAERVAKITHIQPAPSSTKRPKINEVTGSSSENGDCSGGPKLIGDLGRRDELGDGRSESEKRIRPIFRDFSGIRSVISNWSGRWFGHCIIWSCCATSESSLLPEFCCTGRPSVGRRRWPEPLPMRPDCHCSNSLLLNCCVEI